MQQHTPNSDQAAYWTSTAGQKWLTHQEALDQSMVGFLDTLLQEAHLAAGQSILDIGCGTGDSTLKAATQVGPKGSVTGVDISSLLLGRARARAKDTSAKQVDFILSDAQTHRFPVAHFDTVLSRFGMMFFDDPTAAFRNIATALKPGGRLVFVCWAEIAKNPWFKIPRDAAIARLGASSALDSNAPGPLAFRDIKRVCGLLRHAGLTQVSGREVSVDMHPPGTLANVAAFASRVGPAARVMKEFNGSTYDAQAIETAVIAGFRDFETASHVRVPAAINLYTAQVAARTGP